MTKPPRMEAGLTSALKTGMVEILTPMPGANISILLARIQVPHTKSHEQATDQQAPPVLGEGLCEYWEDAADTGLAEVIHQALPDVLTIVQ